MTLEYENPTHVGYAVDQYGLKPTGPLYLIKTDQGVWSRFRYPSEQWNIKTGRSVHATNTWYHELTDVRPITTEELISYWQQDLEYAQQTQRAAQNEVEKQRKRLQELEESLAISLELVQDSEQRLAAAKQAVNDD